MLRRFSSGFSNSFADPRCKSTQRGTDLWWLNHRSRAFTRSRFITSHHVMSCYMPNAYTTVEIEVVRDSRQTSSVADALTANYWVVASSERESALHPSRVAFTDAFNPVSQGSNARARKKHKIYVRNERRIWTALTVIYHDILIEKCGFYSFSFSLFSYVKADASTTSKHHHN